MKASSVFVAHTSYALDVMFSVDGQTLISAGMDNTVKIWSAPDWDLVRALEAHDKSVNSMALSPDGGTLATCSTDASVKLWSFPDCSLQHTLHDRKKTAAAVRFSPDGGWVAAGWYGGRATVWTVAGEVVAGFKASGKNLSTVAFAGEGITLATAGLGDDVALWSLPDGDPIGTLAGHQTAVLSLASIHGGRTLVSLGYEQEIKFWDAQTWQETSTHSLDGPPVRGMAFSPDEALVAISRESVVQLWSVEGWALQGELQIGTKAVNGMAFSPDGRTLAVGAADGKIRIWKI